MTLSLHLARFDASPTHSADPQGTVHPAELLALREVDLVALPELCELPSATSLAPAPTAADHLRLPQPPGRAADGQALFWAMGRAVERFDQSQDRAVSAPAADVVAEAKMIGLLRGIFGLEQEIRAEISRRRRA